ncbi:hypothetical protein A2U01_0007491, partial [Trifolium medium]|nr:hypothetical protein [Trifolium medium]
TTFYCSSSKLEEEEDQITLCEEGEAIERNPFQPNVETKVDASVEDSGIANVEASVKASETLGRENPKSAENLGKSDLSPFADANVDAGTSTKAMSDSVVDSLKGTVPETDVVPDVDTSMAQENVKDQIIPETPEHMITAEIEKSPENVMTSNEEIHSDEHTVVNSQSDESMKTMSANKEDDLSVDKNVNADVVDVDDLASEERSIEKTPVPNIAKRLRSNSGKVVASVSEPDVTTEF